MQKEAADNFGDGINLQLFDRHLKKQTIIDMLNGAALAAPDIARLLGHAVGEIERLQRQLDTLVPPEESE